MAPQWSDDDARRALEIALCQWSTSHLDTLAWCAAGMPETGIEPDIIAFYQAARQIIHENGGTLKNGDAERLLKVTKRKGGSAG